MDYDMLIRRSWLLTWRFRWLWVLGLFVPAGVGASGGGGVPWPPTVPTGDEGRQVQSWLEQYGMALLAIVLTLVAIVLLVGLAFLVVSFIAQGGMVWATAAVALDDPAALGTAWRAGLRFFWRNVGLWLLQVGLVLLLALMIGIAAAMAIAFGSDAVRVAAIVVGFLLILPLILMAIGFGIVVNYAARAIVIENIGPWTSLVVGWRLFYGNLGTSILTWLIHFALGIAASIAVLIGWAVVVIPFALVGFFWYSTSGVGPGLIAYAIVASVLVGAVMWLVTAILNTYFWSYWTLAYLSLTGRMATAPPATPIEPTTSQPGGPHLLGDAGPG